MACDVGVSPSTACYWWSISNKFLGGMYEHTRESEGIQTPTLLTKPHPFIPISLMYYSQHLHDIQ